METTPTPTPSPVNEPKKLTMNRWAALGIFVLVMGGLAAGAYYLKQNTTSVITPPAPITETPTPLPPPPPQSEVYIPPDLFENIPNIYTYPQPKISNLVSWHFPKKINNLEIFIDPNTAQDNYVDFYELGKINEGKYKDYTINLGVLPCQCMGGPSYATILIKAGIKPVFLTKYTDFIEDMALDETTYSLDNTFTISDLEFPEKITGPKPSQVLTAAEPGFFMGSYIPFNADGLKVAFSDPQVGTVFVAASETDKAVYSNNAFYVKSPDWSTKLYILEPNFLDKDGVADVTWEGGEKNKEAYVYTDIGGCGFRNFASVVWPDKVNIGQDLMIAGLTGSGEVVYTFKNTNHSILKDLYEMKYNPFDGVKLPYSEFVKRHPVFFWVDPFDRLIKFENAAFQPQAECAKPAIYLYPTAKTQVSVKVDPKGGFTYTDPEYGNGWEVTAYPDGKIVVDGKEYPYLFWEGRGGLYQTPEKGFIVERNNVHQFLVEKLTQLGLNKQESFDFIEYWEPYMKDAPYYFVTFMDNEALDALAPLEVNPQPDTIIRILMDFEPLEKPKHVIGLEIKTPTRNGFTVVEWGGVKH